MREPDAEPVLAPVPDGFPPGTTLLTTAKPYVRLMPEIPLVDEIF